MSVEHSGVVVTVRSGEVDVQMRVDSACSHCSSRSRCFGDSESSVRTVTVSCNESEYEVGQSVRVSVCSSAAGRAVGLCYVLPLFVLVASVAIGVSSGMSEPMAALCAILSVGVYYFVLWMLRKHISRKINFKISK